jgi:hypothetical protein
MFDRLIQGLQSATWQNALLITVLSIALFILSVVGVAYFLAQLPPTYFQTAAKGESGADGPLIARWIARVLKNTLGVLLLLMGVVLAIPGVPGQGLLTILVGLMLVDFPGKRSVELAVLRRPLVLRSVNRLRAKFSKPPLIL